MEIRTLADGAGLGPAHDAAVVITTLLRPTLLEAVRSVYAQDLGGRIHLLVGVDLRQGPPGLLDRIAAERPSHVSLTICDPGYSTAARNGGLCPSYSGGELRTVLTYLAHGRHVAYLDDDNWWASDHLSSLRRAIEGVGWSYALRWFVHAGTGERQMLDAWSAPDHDPTLPLAARHSYADTNATMLDKLRCHDGVVEWSFPDVPSGEASDRLLWRWLHAHQPGRATGRATVFYRVEDRHRLDARIDRRSPRAGRARRPLASLAASVAGDAQSLDPPADALETEILAVGVSPEEVIAIAAGAPRSVLLMLDDWRTGDPAPGGDPPAVYRAFRQRIAQQGMAGRVHAMPMRPLPALRFLLRVGVAVDRAHVDIDRATGDAMRKAWLDAAAGAMRPGGVLQVRADGAASAAALAAFAAALDAEPMAADAAGYRRLVLSDA